MIFLSSWQLKNKQSILFVSHIVKIQFSTGKLTVKSVLNSTTLFCLIQSNLPLKDPSQPPSFAMPSKLLILHGEAKSYCLTVSCVPESMFHCL